MGSRARRSNRVVSSVLLLTGLSACATTVVDSTATTTSTSTTTTTVAPTGTSELLTALLERIRGLSEIVVETGGQAARDRLAEIEDLWERARPAVTATQESLVEDFERMIALCRLAVERRRPAEADKAYAFLTPLVAAVSTASS